MKKSRWVEIAKNRSEVRFQVLNEYLNDNGFASEVNFVEVEPAQFEDKLKEVTQEYDVIRIGSPYGQSVTSLFDGQSTELRTLKAADCLWKVKDRWTLMSANHIGMQRIVLDIGKQLDLETSVLVVGAGAGARVCISAFIRVGVKKINITNKFVEQAKELIDDLRKTYFGVEFEFIPEERLVLLPGTNGVLVNTTPLAVGNDLLKELYYFNFLKSPGIVMDFTFVPIDTPLVMEAEQIGIRAVRGYEISSWGDMAWVESCFGLHLKREEYCERLRKKVSEIEFDMTPFLKE